MQWVRWILDATPFNSVKYPQRGKAIPHVIFSIKPSKTLKNKLVGTALPPAPSAPRVCPCVAPSFHRNPAVPGFISSSVFVTATCYSRSLLAERVTESSALRFLYINSMCFGKTLPASYRKKSFLLEKGDLFPKGTVQGWQWFFSPPTFNWTSPLKKLCIKTVKPAVRFHLKKCSLRSRSTVNYCTVP